MMKNIKHIILFGSLAIAAAGFQACKSVKDNAANITSAQDFSSAETEFSGAFDLVDDINQSDGKIKKGGSSVLPSGAIFTWIDSSFIDGDGVEYTVDFGPLGATAPKGLLCGDGKYRAGILRVSVSKRYFEIGTVVNVLASKTTNGNAYFGGDGTNMFELEGEVIITRTAAEEVTVETKGGKITTPAGKVATFQGNRLIKRTAGSGTPGIWGDVYEVTGSGKGVNTEGEDYTWEITKALVKKLEPGCAKTFVIGIITVKNVSASSSISVDFDTYKNGACDKIATAIIGKKEIIFTVN